MEEMKNLNVEDTITEVAEVVTDKLSFKENCIAYGLVGLVGIGAATVSYYGFKGGQKLYRAIKNKRAKSATKHEIVVDVNDNLDGDLNEEYDSE